MGFTFRVSLCSSVLAAYCCDHTGMCTIVGDWASHSTAVEYKLQSGSFLSRVHKKKEAGLEWESGCREMRLQGSASSAHLCLMPSPPITEASKGGVRL